MENLNSLKLLTEVVRNVGKPEELEESTLSKPIADYTDSELSGIASKARDLIKRTGKGNSPKTEEKLKEVERELGKRAANATKKAMSKPEYRKRALAG